MKWKKKCLDYLIPGSSQFVILLMEIKLGAQSRFKYIEMRIGKERIYILYWKRLHFLTWHDTLHNEGADQSKPLVDFASRGPSNKQSTFCFWDLNSLATDKENPVCHTENIYSNLWIFLVSFPFTN